MKLEAQVACRKMVLSKRRQLRNKESRNLVQSTRAATYPYEPNVRPLWCTLSAVTLVY